MKQVFRVGERADRKLDAALDLKAQKETFKSWIRVRSDSSRPAGRLDGSQEATELAGLTQEVPRAAGRSGPAGQPSGPDFDPLAKHCDFGSCGPSQQRRAVPQTVPPEQSASLRHRDGPLADLRA